MHAGLVIDIPGRRPFAVHHLVLDFNGTIAVGGRLSPGVRGRLRELEHRLDVVVLTADTFGTVARALGRRWRVETIRSGEDKARFVRARKGEGVVAVGNGRNDVAMLRAAALGIAVMGPEGLCPAAIDSADVLVARVEDALDLLLDTTRLVATLRR